MATSNNGEVFFKDLEEEFRLVKDLLTLLKVKEIRDDIDPVNRFLMLWTAVEVWKTHVLGRSESKHREKMHEIFKKYGLKKTLMKYTSVEMTYFMKAKKRMQ